MENDKIHLTREQEGETYLPTLYGKALDARAQDSILGDRFADEAVRRIDLDFAKKYRSIAQGGAVTLPLRARLLDTWVREFLEAHPESTVLNLGTGLDSRVYRIDPPATVRWYDVDLPDVIGLRRRLYPERQGYELVSSSVTDLRWLDAIPGDRPVSVVAEGLMMYLPEKEGVALLDRITTQFPSGQIAFDAYSRFTVGVLNLASRFAKGTAAGSRVHLPWGIDDPHKLQKQVPRLKLVTAVSFLTLPELVQRLSRSPSQTRMANMMGRWKWYQKGMLHLRYEF
ncbi:MAG: class I SAM-dependent methyltransferase [Bacteroidota bacterium]